MTVVRRYHLKPTALVPNSPYPLLHYPGLLAKECRESPNQAAVKCHEITTKNGWYTQWIFRYGQTQESHYHSQAHECMVVLTGTATIRFGVADTSKDLHESTYGSGREEGGVELEANAGDVFILPPGLAHKTFDTSPPAPFALLTPGEGHGIEGDVNSVLTGIKLEGFTMLGSYASADGPWSFSVGGDDVGNYENVWSLPVPEKDPFLGESIDGIKGSWNEARKSLL